MLIFHRNNALRSSPPRNFVDAASNDCCAPVTRSAALKRKKGERERERCPRVWNRIGFLRTIHGYTRRLEINSIKIAALPPTFLRNFSTCVHAYVPLFSFFFFLIPSPNNSSIIPPLNRKHWKLKNTRADFIRLSSDRLV